MNHHLRRWLYSGEEVYKVIDAGMGFGKIGFMLQLEFADVRMDIYGYDVFEKGVTYSKKLGICLLRSRDLGHPQQFRMKIKASTLDLASSSGAFGEAGGILAS